MANVKGVTTIEWLRSKFTMACGLYRATQVDTRQLGQVLVFGKGQ